MPTTWTHEGVSTTSDGGPLDLSTLTVTSTIGHADDTDLMTLASGALTVSGTLTVGVDDTGYDVKFYGATASSFMHWDESEDQLIIQCTDNGHPLVLKTTDPDATTGPLLNFHRVNSDNTAANNDSIGGMVFYGEDAAGNNTLYGQIYNQILDSGDGSEIGSFQFKVMTESASGNAVKTGIWLKGSSTNDVVTCNIPNGGVIVGQNSSVQGTLTLWDGSGGNTPGYLILYSPNGTANYIFCEDDGTLKRHTSAPTANSDGSEIGGQS